MLKEEKRHVYIFVAFSLATLFVIPRATLYLRKIPSLMGHLIIFCLHTWLLSFRGEMKSFQCPLVLTPDCDLFILLLLLFLFDSLWLYVLVFGGPCSMQAWIATKIHRILGQEITHAHNWGIFLVSCECSNSAFGSFRLI